MTRRKPIGAVGSTNRRILWQLAAEHPLISLKMTRIILLLAIAILMRIPAAAEPVLYPLPQKSNASGGITSLSSKARIEGVDKADPNAVALLKARLSHCDADGRITRVLIGERGDSAVAAYFEGVPERSGAYRLRVTGDQLVIAGHDGRGTYYGVRSLEQLIDADGKLATLPEIDVTDWPDVPFRGAVEGFYGTPWSHENRLSLIRFFGKHKLDTYIYGPKDDPFHSSPNWRKPYPPAEAAKIRELASISRAHKVDFVWAIHPGKDIQWTEADFRAVIEKFESMYGLGVRSFAVFFDDISGAGTKADQQAKLLNFLHEQFVVKKRDVTPLIVCPTEYNKDWSNPTPGTYLDILGETLHPSIHVMWTGNSVVADLDQTSMEWINRRIKRKAYIWWNFPASDYVRNHLLLGRVYGNAPDAIDLLGGFVSNPMERAEASKIALFGVAGYAWNAKSYDSKSAWRAAIREVMPRAAEAFEVFCSHNSDLGPNGHGYRREESVEFASAANSFLAAFRACRVNQAPDPQTVRPEFERIRQAPAAIRTGSTNAGLIAEINPWLDAFEQLGRAGVAALDAHTALLSKTPAEAWPFLAEAYAALARMAEIDKTQNCNPYQPGIVTGSLVVTPFVRELVDTTSARFLSQLSGRSQFRPGGITSTSERESFPLMLDGKDDTFYYCKSLQKTGDWFGVDLGGLNKVTRIRLLQGRNDDDHDRVHQGVLEGAATDDQWEEIAIVRDSRVDVKLDPPKNCRFIRLRVTQAGSPNKPDVWTAIRSFEVNPVEVAALRTDVVAFEKQPVRSSGQEVSISPMLEVRPFPPDKYLGLFFPEVVDAARLEVDLKTAGPDKIFSLEATPDGRSWKPLATRTDATLMTVPAVGKIIAVRVRSTQRSTPSVTLSKFALTLNPSSATDSLAALTDGHLDTSAEVKPDGLSVIRPPAGKPPTLVTVLRATGNTSAATLEAVVGTTRLPLGPLAGPVTWFKLPPATTGIAFSSNGTPASLRIHEVVWSWR